MPGTGKPNPTKTHGAQLRPSAPTLVTFAGGEAQAALEAAVQVAPTPDAELLEARCGTGRFARGLMDWLMCKGLSRRQTGRFLEVDDVTQSLARAMRGEVQILPSAGPAATLAAPRCRA